VTSCGAADGWLGAIVGICTGGCLAAVDEISFVESFVNEDDGAALDVTGCVALLLLLLLLVLLLVFTLLQAWLKNNLSGSQFSRFSLL
jgi:hypothetical protein